MKRNLNLKFTGDFVRRFRKTYFPILMILLVTGVAAQSLFTESGGQESFSTQNYSVYTTGVDGVGDRALNLTGNVTGLSSVNESVEVWFEVRKAGTSDPWIEFDAGSLEQEGTFSTVAEGLDPGTNYEFKASTKDYNGSLMTQSTGSYTISTEGDDVGTDWIRFYGNISGINQFTDDIGDDIQLGFDYRQTGAASWNSVNVTKRTTDGEFSERVEGLSSGTEYEYRAYSGDDFQGSVLTGTTFTGVFTTSGGVESFTTDDYSVTTNGTDGIGDRSLNMTGEIHNLSDLEVPIEVFFNITDQSDGTTTKVDAGTVDGSGVISVVKTGLDPDTTYNFKACTNHYCGSENSVTTSDYNVSTVSDTDVGVDWIRFRGKITNVAQFTEDINDRIKLYIDYRPVGGSWSSVQVTDRVNDGFFEERVDGLQQGTTYEYKAYSEDGIEGNVLQASTLPGVFTVSGGVVTFTTGTLFNVSIIDVKNPVIEGDNVEVDFEVENEGAQGLGNVTLNVPGIGTNKSEYNLTQGEIVQDTITLETTAGDAGEYTANISSDKDSATRNFNISELNAPIDPTPVDGKDVVGLKENLSVKSNTSGVNVNIEFYLNDSNQFIGSQTGISYQDRANTSLSSIDPDPNTTYEWYALTEYNGQTVKSDIYNFTTVERPEVLSIEPANNSKGVGKNPILNATVGGNAQINITFHDYDKADSDFYSTTVSPSTTSSYDLQNYGDMGEGVTERWWLELESKGAQWNNSNDPYEFLVSEASEVNYNSIEFEEGDNMNPGKFGSLNKVFGPKTIKFEVTNPEGVKMGNIGLNVSNSTYSDTKFTNQVGSGEEVSIDVSDKIDENQLYNITAFYQEGTTKFTGSDFTTSDLEFSSYVVELEWDAPPKHANDYVVYYNGTQSTPFSDYSKLGKTSNSQNIGAANRELGSGLDECFRVTARNYLREEGNPTGEECVGGVP